MRLYFEPYFSVNAPVDTTGSSDSGSTGEDTSTTPVTSACDCQKDNVNVVIDDQTLAEFKAAAAQWAPVLLALPFASMGDVTKIMTVCNGVRGKKYYGSISSNSQFRPFKLGRKHEETKVDIEYRPLETFEADVIDKFAPVLYANLPLAYNDPVISDEIKNAGFAATVMAALSSARGEGVAQSLITGVYNPEGDTSIDVCNGLATIIANEIASGSIAEGKENLFSAGAAFDSSNACDIAKEAVKSLDSRLRAMDTFLVCSQKFADDYNDSYLKTHISTPYNTAFNQPFVEGSNGKCTIMPLPQLDGVDTYWITPKINMLFGNYALKDFAFIDVKVVDHYHLSMCQHVWWGTQFHTINKRFFKALKMA